MLNNEIIVGFNDEKDENLTITVEKVKDIDSCLVIYLIGSIDTNNVKFFQEKVVRAIEAGFTKLIFHCGDLTAISSAGINSFSLFLNLIKSKGGNEVFYAIQPKVQEVFQVLDFSKVFTIKESLEASLDVFRKQNVKILLPFPMKLECPVCSLEFELIKEGHFICSKCNAALTVDSCGQIFLG